MKNLIKEAITRLLSGNENQCEWILSYPGIEENIDSMALIITEGMNDSNSKVKEVMLESPELFNREVDEFKRRLKQLRCLGEL